MVAEALTKETVAFQYLVVEAALDVGEPRRQKSCYRRVEVILALGGRLCIKKYHTYLKVRR